MDDWAWTCVPVHNNENRVDFVATADSSGVVVFQYADKGVYGYRLSGLTMIPEPGSLVLLLGLAGLGLVAFLRRK